MCYNFQKYDLCSLNSTKKLSYSLKPESAYFAPIRVLLRLVRQRYIPDDVAIFKFTLIKMGRYN